MCRSRSPFPLSVLQPATVLIGLGESWQYTPEWYTKVTYFSRHFSNSSLDVPSQIMPLPRVYRTEALVLKGRDYGEADRILTLYTPHAGKIGGIAKGVRRARSRKAGHLDLFTRSNLLLAKGRQLDVITQAETVETFRSLRDDLWRSTYSHYVADLVDSFSPENHPNYPLYVLSIVTLRRLAAASDLDLVLRSFEVQLLGLTGYRPQLHRCLHCNSDIEPVPNRFSAKMGGVLCPACAGTDAAAPVITVPALKVLRNLQTNEDAMLLVRNLDREVHSQVERLLQDYIVYRLEHRPRSIAILERLRSERIIGSPG